VRAVVVGCGAVGRHATRVLSEDPKCESVVVVHRDPRRVAGLVKTLGQRVEWLRGGANELPDADVTVVSVPTGARRITAGALAGGSHVVCVTDEPSEVRALLELDTQARHKGLSVVVGAAMAPGLSCVLAAQLARRFDTVEEIHVASMGTGGPACARRHHSALAAIAVDWEDGEWRRRPGGSGRELLWFPEPVGGADCYRAALADPLLLVRAYTSCRRVTSRMEATRRDRVSSWLPMLRPPHPEGLVGAVRVELRGRVRGRAETYVLGAAVAPAVAAGAVAATAARWAATGQLARAGAAGLAELVFSPGVFLRELVPHGVTVSAFEGQATTVKDGAGAPGDG
jgi:saccharopine dehydrogenase-like NADP-dependent oxidoreductase